MVIDVNVLTNGWTIAGVVASFLVAVVALSLGLKSIYETRHLQDIKFREEILDEISDWLMDITEFKNVGGIATFSELQQFFADTYKTKMSLSLEAWGKQDECLKLANKGKIIATNFHDVEKPLPKTIIKLINKLNDLSDLNRGYSGEFAKLPNDIKIMDLLGSLGKYNTECHSIHREKQGYMNTIMDEVTKLRHKKLFS